MDQMQSTDLIDATETPAIALNEAGNIVDANKHAVLALGRDGESLRSIGISDLVPESDLKCGKLLEHCLETEHSSGVKFVRGDGSLITTECNSTPKELGGERYFEARFEVTGEVSDEGAALEPGDTPNADAFEDIDAEELQTIVQNIRVDTPDGKMPLNALMLDLAVGHNELEQYKNGALSMYNALDDRLIEEEKRNPDSSECDVLDEAKKTAFGLYLRVQRGDEELHGNRDGQYSGYFN